MSLSAHLQVMAPMVPAKGDDGTEGFAPALDTRFFTDDTAHGMNVMRLSLQIRQS